MYENATVLDYDNRKIWIKRVGENVYLVNGCIISCKEMNRMPVDRIASVLDVWYTPFNKYFSPSKYVLSYWKNRGGRYVSTHTPIYQYIIDSRNLIDFVELVIARDEYEAWSNFILKKFIYINDCRNMNEKEYILKYCTPVKK